MAAAGKDRGTPTAELVEDYLARAKPLGRGLGIDGPSLHVIEAPKALRGAERQAREAALLLDAVPDGDGIVLLEERGKTLKSRALSELIAKERDSGAPGLCFMIGGADGFGEALTAAHPRVRGTLSFGAATWPHMLCRAMLSEQLYRALTLLAGHPYHRD